MDNHQSTAHNFYSYVPNSSENYLWCGYNQSRQKSQGAKEKKYYGDETDKIWKPALKW